MFGFSASNESLNVGAVEVGQLTGEEFIQSHFDGKYFIALKPVFLGLPMVMGPAEFQLWNFAVNVEQIAPLFQRIHRPSVGFVTVTDSHIRGYALSTENHHHWDSAVPRIHVKGCGRGELPPQLS